jgi:hypothetical protein
VTAVSQGKGLVHPALSRLIVRLIVCAALVSGAPAIVLAQVRPTYLHNLSTFTGPLREDWVRLQVDKARDETYVIYQNVVRVFNQSGMQIFSFGEDLDVGQIVDLAVLADGSLVLLSSKDSVAHVTRCNYRGVPLGRLDISKLPPGLKFQPNRLISAADLYYFVSLASGTVIVTDANGEFRKTIDLLGSLDEDEKKKSNGAEVSGFTVDQEGNIFYTVPTLFRAYKLSADGTATSFGAPGSAAGKFGVIAGIAVDSHGNILVADKLKCVVMAFDKDFRFLGEFGYRGAARQNLIFPDDLTIDSKDRLYVSQARRRGISVFALNPS